jgi:hypothetical protein
MPAPRGKLTDLPELGAYVLAHVVGIAWGIIANPLIFRSLVTQGYREHLQMIAIAISIVVALVVLLIFLGLRKLFAGATAAPPPPAAPPVLPPKFTDGPELAAYVLAHGAGIAWGATVTPLIFRSLIANGHPAYSLALVGFSMSIGVAVVVLLIFLFLRKVMSGPATN